MKDWLAALVLLCAATVACSQPTTYLVTATGNYTLLSNFTAPCNTGPCQDFNTGIGASGSFTTAAPLAANLVAANITALVTSFSFSDGIHTYASTDPAVRVFLFNISTNGAGAITASDVRVQRWLTGGPVQVAGDRISMLEIRATSEVDYNAPCLTVGLSPAGVAGSCSVIGNDTSRSLAFGSARAWAIAAVATAVAAVPTLSEWGLILMAGLVGLAALATLRRGFTPR